MVVRIRAMIKKEILHILRDPRTLVILFVMPVMMVCIFGYALNMDMKHIPIGIIDHDNSPASRSVINDLTASEYFDLKTYLQNNAETDLLFREREIKAVMIIPEGFAKDLVKNPPAQLQLLVDGSDPSFGNATVNYSSSIVLRHTLDYFPDQQVLPLDIRETFLYNPDLEGSHFVIPGLVAVMTAKLKEESGWDVLVGPREAMGIPKYLKSLAV